MIIKEILQKSSRKIFLNEVEILLAFILNRKKEWLWAHGEKSLSENQDKKFKKIMKRRIAGEPLPYLINHQEFFGLDFYVDKNVLIPRPETEILVEEVLDEVRSKKLEDKKMIKIADIGTGSGCIGVAIATKLKTKNLKLKTYATDISQKALKIAKRNATKHKVSNKIIFLHGDLLDALPEKVDIIIANLPYVKNDTDVNRHEPKMALFGGKVGLEKIKKLLKQAPKYLRPKGIIILEISPEQKEELAKFIPKIIPNCRFQFEKDYGNKTRLVKILLSA